MAGTAEIQQHPELVAGQAVPVTDAGKPHRGRNVGGRRAGFDHVALDDYRVEPDIGPAEDVQPFLVVVNEDIMQTDRDGRRLLRGRGASFLRGSLEHERAGNRTRVN